MKVTSLLVGCALLLSIIPASAQQVQQQRVERVEGYLAIPERLEFDESLLSQLKVPEGFRIDVFAKNLGNPRNLAVAPDGTIYVTRREQGDVLALYDRDGDGRADGYNIVASGLPYVNGITIHDNRLYFITDKQLYVADLGSEGIEGEPQILIDNLPDAGKNRGSDEGELVLIDFGMAKQATAKSITKPETTIGTYGYAPFEQMEEGKAYPASDLYSLGVTCFYLLTWIFPNQLLNQQGYGWTNSWRQHLPHPISDELAKILDKLLQPKYQDRYQSVEEVLKDLNVILLQSGKIVSVVSAHQSSSQQLQQQLTQNPRNVSIWNLLPSAVIAGAGSSFLAIVLLSFTRNISISYGLGLLILGVLIFFQNRTFFDKTYLLIIASITTLAILSIFKNQQIYNPFFSGFEGVMIVVLLVTLAGLLVFIMMSMAQIFNRIISRLF